MGALAVSSASSRETVYGTGQAASSERRVTLAPAISLRSVAVVSTTRSCGCNDDNSALHCVMLSLHVHEPSHPAAGHAFHLTSRIRGLEGHFVHHCILVCHGYPTGSGTKSNSAATVGRWSMGVYFFTSAWNALIKRSTASARPTGSARACHSGVGRHEFSS